jgi:DNA (cytosine-5)-methyltransferase 1
VDLFCGLGAFHQAFKSFGGFDCVFACDIDERARRIYEENHGLKPEGDIRAVDPSSLPDFDVLCAGFPCQPFSIAGESKKNSLGRKHGFQDAEQGNLFFAICDIVSEKKPAVLFLENVKNLRSHDKGKTWKVITEAIDALGYEMKFQIIDAQGWVPQHRERIYMVCFNRNKFTKAEIELFEFPSSSSKKLTLSTILEEDPDKKYMLTDNLWTYLQKYAAKHAAAGNGFGFGLVGPNDISRTMSARYYKDGSEILIKQPRWRNPRRLTPREASKLMGFNERLAKFMGHKKHLPQVVSDMQSYKQFGNSVSPLVVEAIGNEIKKVLMKRKVRLKSKAGKSSSGRTK